jgi:hypothetical protein
MVLNDQVSGGLSNVDAQNHGFLDHRSFDVLDSLMADDSQRLCSRSSTSSHDSIRFFYFAKSQTS